MIISGKTGAVSGRFSFHKGSPALLDFFFYILINQFENPMCGSKYYIYIL
jgi:hypothetical protein